MSKKKIIILVIAIVMALMIIGGIIYWIGFSGKTEMKNNELEGNDSKLSKLYTELLEKQAYSFTTTLDDKNSTFYVKKDKMAYIDTTYQGDKSKFLIKDGNAYLLLDDQKIYYTYQNNETDLEKISVQLNEIKDKQYTEGKEKIENKEYKYEEYEGATDFLVNDIEEAEQTDAKTRFYFNGDKLIYIKTIIGDYQELLKVNISYNVDNKLFEIPSDYRGM